jgi:hypothetical protein
MKKTILILIAANFLSFCSRDSQVEGPLLQDLYGDFSVLEDFALNTNEVDFASNENVIFTAAFSISVSWELEITGLRSGARAIINGQSSRLDALNATWRGSSTILPMFKDEDCRVVLKVPSQSYADTLELNILSPKISEGFVIADFENGFNPAWNTFVQSGANMSFRIVQSDTAAQGSNYYDMGGAVSWDYLIGLVDFPRASYTNNTFGLPSNSNNLFFNVFLYKPANINNEIVLFRFMEDDNEDGVFNETNEDMYALEVRGLNPGWQMVSVKYSDLQYLMNGQPAPSPGNGIKEPQKLFQVSVLFLADPATGYSQVFMDNLIFTQNTPFQP